MCSVFLITCRCTRITLKSLPLSSEVLAIHEDATPLPASSLMSSYLPSLVA